MHRDQVAGKTIAMHRLFRRRSFVITYIDVNVMAEVCPPNFIAIHAIACSACPGPLERHHQQQENDEQSTHGVTQL